MTYKYNKKLTLKKINTDEYIDFANNLTRNSPPPQRKPKKKKREKEEEG